MRKKDIKNFTLNQLKKEIEDLRQPSYRAGQIFFWLYKKGAGSFEEMTDLPLSLKEELRQKYYIGGLKLAKHLKSKDKTEKFLFSLHDGNFIETVLIKTKQRETICLSTQVGCKYGCAFCASGRKRFARNLSPSEIVGQISFLQFNLKHKITNYVFMGMGEPLDNFSNLEKAVIIMNDAKGLNIGARRITVSTCGIIRGIEKLKNLGLQVNLSVSLHAANDFLRNKLVPVNRKYGLRELIAACEDFSKTTGRMITLEYALIKGQNDFSKDVDGLAVIAKKLKAKVNLIPYSFVPSFRFKSPTDEEVEIFAAKLIKRGVNVTVRQSKGKDIHAACGQLAGRMDA